MPWIPGTLEMPKNANIFQKIQTKILRNYRRCFFHLDLNLLLFTSERVFGKKTVDFLLHRIAAWSHVRKSALCNDSPQFFAITSGGSSSILFSIRCCLIVREYSTKSLRLCSSLWNVDRQKMPKKYSLRHFSMLKLNFIRNNKFYPKFHPKCLISSIQISFNSCLWKIFADKSMFFRSLKWTPVLPKSAISNDFPRSSVSSI